MFIKHNYIQRHSIFFSLHAAHRSIHGELSSNRRSLQLSDNVLIIYCLFSLSLTFSYLHFHLLKDDTITIATALYDTFFLVSIFPFIYFAIYGYKVKASNFYFFFYVHKRKRCKKKVKVGMGKLQS